jgi:uncharacterized protein (DUF2126 family)/transglutaminase-like putative cysteine protease
MTIHVALEHRTCYEFDRSVGLSPHVVRLRPAPHTRTPILSYSLKVEPAGHFLNWQQDPFGNYLARLVFPEKVRKLDITVDLVAELTPVNPFDFFLEPEVEQYPFTYEDTLAHELAPYLVSEEPGPLLAEWLASVDISTTPTNDFLVMLNQRVCTDISYSTRMEPGVQTPEETLRRRIGSCRDSAWLLVTILRRLGLAARFASGYLVQLVADQKPLEGPSGPIADFTDLHAWTEVYLPGAGWIGMDPTSGLFASEGHIPLACSPDPSSAAPVTGAMDEAEVEFSHSNVVRRIYESPRVTLPYSDAQWSAIDQLGRAVDVDLAAGDVRLTQGGEPTFVSVSDMESPEWTIAPDGPNKRAMAYKLTKKLAQRFAPGGLLHFGQGKWYPGEELPRWQMEILWRTDGVPLWRDHSLLASPWPDPDAKVGQSLWQANPAKTDTAATAATNGTLPGGPESNGKAKTTSRAGSPESARDLMHTIADRLGIPPRYCLPTYEDPLDRLVAEALLPDGSPPEHDVDPTDPELADARKRARLLAELDANKGDPVGWTLFVHPVSGAVGERTRWGTTAWALRRGHLMLRPGDSPLGLRLPLSSLNWSTPPPTFERSTFEQREPLPPLPTRWAHTRNGVTPKPPRPATAAASKPAPPVPPGQDPASAVVTPSGQAPYSALCVQVRNGRAHVFLPPLQYLEHAVELLAAIEESAAATDTPVVLEGYPLPNDPRLTRLVVGADPGVIEVNMHPSANWPQLVEITEGLYEDAHQCSLGTEKFDVDGLHTGTGGGNHVTLGGATPADSPLLRRPDLLRSLITFWQHHPSLSYLFSGRFIGPTSQSPRVDEGRGETLYELEIAFAELERAQRNAGNHPDQQGLYGLGGQTPAWIPDRLLRHLLTDITGNTHRAEFCIDKLYAPGSERGRLGLLELRAFEMPPHARMGLVQALLVRALVARFWKTPYAMPLVRWGTELHDRFLLPAYVAADVAEVTADLRRHGYQFEQEWLAPFLEFRFPLIGKVEVASVGGAVGLELRTAIEPWPVLGEEVAANGPARYVDSSVERLQVLVTGMTAGRHLVTCNGVPIPLRPTGTPGESVAGVRYRAWQPFSALHPTIGIHAPLVFDLVDTWNGQSLGGCTYHVTHPGGRGYDDFPVNAGAAAARRASRFSPLGHTPGPIEVSAPVSVVGQDEYPHTVDLRRVPFRAMR